MTEKRRHKGFSLAPETIGLIKLRAVELSVNDSKALDIIVEQWADDRAKELALDANQDDKTIELKERLDSLETSLKSAWVILGNLQPSSDKFRPTANHKH